VFRRSAGSLWPARHRVRNVAEPKSGLKATSLVEVMHAGVFTIALKQDDSASVVPLIRHGRHRTNGQDRPPTLHGSSGG
jgi:hypothetical protein